VPRTILAIAQEAAERDATAPRPTTLYGTNDRVARILRTAAKDTLREYLRSTRAKGLSEFTGTWVFATQAGRFAYAIPPDYLRMIPNTEHLGGWPLGLIGPASPQLWAWWMSSGSTTPGSHAWRIRNNTILLNPTPAEATLVQIEYISRYPVVSAITADDLDLTGPYPAVISPLVPRDGYITAAGMQAAEPPPQPESFVFDGEPGFDVGVWPTEPTEVLKRLNLLSQASPLPQVRRPEFAADTDMPAFDDDYPLSLGMTFRLRRALGFPYAEVAAEYEEELEAKMTEDAGGPRAFRIGAGDDDHVDTWPLGGDRWLVT
jgi:hypothetical protein